MSNESDTEKHAVARSAHRPALVSRFINIRNMAWITKGNPVVCDFMAQAADEIVIPIIDAVSEALETPVETLPPLSDVIDVDGLETLITESQAHDVTVTFVYAGLRVLVHSDGTVYVRPLQGTRIGLGNETTDSNG